LLVLLDGRERLWEGEGLERGKTMDAETSWGEVVTALAVIVIIAFLWLTA
jgi:hypothetical protein